MTICQNGFSLTALSLFASSGIGDLALSAAGGHLLVANELIPDRADLLRANFPHTEVITGDIREVASDLVQSTKERLDGRNLDVLFATPPCQGMSKNGRGKLLQGIREGYREKIDPRNQLATYVPAVVNALRPKVVLFENVPEMKTTLIVDEDGQLVDLLDFLLESMSDYLGCWKVIEFADYGVPQRRQRLITIFVRKDVDLNLSEMSFEKLCSHLFPPPTHSSKPSIFEKPWITVSDAISHLPKLDASSKETARDAKLDFHYVPLLDDTKYWWVSHTPPGASAFDNQCTNSACGYTKNPTHGSSRINGINRSRYDTPIYCTKCSELLPRPVTYSSDKDPRLMRGFTSAYKRMRWDLPASAMTRNLSYACSDQKLHPTQHRVLSLLEAMMLQTITDYEYSWNLPNGKRASDKLIRDTIGESVPPRGLQCLFEHVFSALFGLSPTRSCEFSDQVNVRT